MVSFRIYGDRMDYFKEALSDFVRDFSDGGAIRHMVDRGMTLNEIMKSGHVTMSREKVAAYMEKYLKEKEKKKGKI